MGNYLNTEKSLKRFLKRKAKITLGFVVAFMIMGTGVFADIITDPIDKQGTVAYKDTIADDINIKSDNNRGIILVSTNIKNDYHDLKVQSNNIHIDLNREGECRGINISGGSKFNLGKKETERVTINVTTVNGTTMGIANLSSKIMGTQILGSETIVNGKKLEMTLKSTDGVVVGIQTQHNTNLPHDKITDNIKVARVEVNSEDTIINVNSVNGNAVGLACFSNSHMDINGNLTVNAKSENGLSVALNTRGNSILNINQSENKKVVLNGDIYFMHQGSHEGEKDTRVNLNLSTKDSILNGKIYRDDKYITSDGVEYDYKDLEYSENNGMLLSLSNGGTWKVTGDSFVNDLTMNGGVIEVTENVEEIKVDNLHGDSGMAMFAASIDEEELKITDGKLNIGSSDKTNLEVGLSGVNTDDLAGKNISAKSALAKLTGKVTGNGIEDIDQTLFVNGGTLTGKVTAEVGENGEIINMQQAEDTPITAAVRDLTGINYLSWKQEMGSLSQRMGELRDSSAEHGVWARVYGGKVENGSQYDNEYQTYQVGYDKKYSVDNGKVYLGYLVSYTDGETNYEYGSGENSSVGAGIYATWMNNNGHYVDVLYKVSRLNNKFDMKDVESLKGDYDTYGISLSAEYGKRFDIAEKWFAEPSVGMHLGRLGEETYTTNTGIEISQDSVYTAEGRIGTALGYKFNDNGNVYVRTHVVKEFAGDVDTEYERNGVSAKTSEDLSDTWFEFGIGANYRFRENINVYADIEKSGDATVDTEWQGNLGFRYEF